MALPTGYSFRSVLSIEQIRTRLQELGHGEWEEGDSAWYGDYIRGDLWGTYMRIFDGHGQANEFGRYDPKGFMLLDYGRRGTPTAEMDTRIRDELFPALQVIEWKPDEAND